MLFALQSRQLAKEAAAQKYIAEEALLDAEEKRLAAVTSDSLAQIAAQEANTAKEEALRQADLAQRSDSLAQIEKIRALTARERAELVPFKEHWDPARVPKVDKVILVPLPDPSARTAALLSGQVDWIEAPAPDAIPRIKSQGLEVVSNVYPHVWPWHFSRVEGSPWNDERIRKAANLAVDRDGIVQLLGGYGVPATGHVVKGNPWYGSPTFEIKRDVEAAKKLVAEAGFGPDKPVKVKMSISAWGSGQMLPLQMNEYIQQNLKDVGIEVEFNVVEWQALLDIWRAGAKSPQAAGSHGVNVSYTTQDPYSAFTRFLRSDLAAPAGVNSPSTCTQRSRSVTPNWFWPS